MGVVVVPCCLGLNDPHPYESDTHSTGTSSVSSSRSSSCSSNSSSSDSCTITISSPTNYDPTDSKNDPTMKSCCCTTSSSSNNPPNSNHMNRSYCCHDDNDDDDDHVASSSIQQNDYNNNNKNKNEKLKSVLHSSVSSSSLPSSKSSSSLSTSSSSFRVMIVIRFVLRFILLDTPLCILLFTYMSLLFVQHVHMTYWVPQLDALQDHPTDNSGVETTTYYHRYCSENDMSTMNVNDLFVPSYPESTTTSSTRTTKSIIVDDIVHHQFLHGFTIFPNALTSKTATNLRTYIDQRNQRIKNKKEKDKTDQDNDDHDQVFVLEGTNRYSYGLGTDEPTVVAAVMELFNHENENDENVNRNSGSGTLLKQTLEQILGPNPALLEMSHITSTYGAIEQIWHSDVIKTSSTLYNARKYGPAYSLFIQLQNTTKAMGSTSVCPGTHYCVDGDMDTFCQKYGFQITTSKINNNINHNNNANHTTIRTEKVGGSDEEEEVDDEEEYWRIGDAVLMNMNSYHRGMGHIDMESGMDRIMFILTFVPRPLPRSETRQISLGVTFSLRWDMWGQTLYDLCYANQIRSYYPFTILRSFGLHKQKTTTTTTATSTNAKDNPQWGIDYITTALMRIANDDHGYRQEQLEPYIQNGGLPYVPTFLQGQVNFIDDDDDSNNGWYYYLSQTLQLCLQFAQYCTVAGIVYYLVVFTKVFVHVPPSSSGRQQYNNNRSCSQSFYQGMIRVWILCTSMSLLYKYAKYHVDHSDWAYDITHSLKYNNTAMYDQEAFVLFEKIDETALSTTFPTKYDVLIETRFGSESLAKYNDFIPKYHPGNVYLNELIQRSLVTVPRGTFSRYERMYQDQWARNILEEVNYNGGRIFLQNGYGYWLWMDQKEHINTDTDNNNDNYAISYIKKQLTLTSSSSKTVRYLLEQVRFVRSYCKDGPNRHHTMVRKHTATFLHELQQQMEYNVLNNNIKTIQNHNKKKHDTIHSISMMNLKKSYTYFQLHRDGKTKLSVIHLFKSSSHHPLLLKRLKNRNNGITFESPPIYKEPRDGVWLASGDVAEIYYKPYWYRCTINSVTSHGKYYVTTADGSKRVANVYNIRRLRPFTIGEEIEIAGWNETLGAAELYNGTIVEVRQLNRNKDDYDNDNDRNKNHPEVDSERNYVYDIYVPVFDGIMTDATALSLRRRGVRKTLAEILF